MMALSKQVTNRWPRIAILGWGSLLWDKRPDFDETHAKWQLDGPILPLEFSRVSASRNNALTLVIDTNNGTDCRVAYAMSKRLNPEDTIADLRCREGTIMKWIGYYFADDSNRAKVDVPSAIVSWAKEKRFDVVVWTGLPSNFKQKTKREFTIDAAIKHLQGLLPEGKANAASYVWRAPAFVQTKLREVLETEPWFEVGQVQITGTSRDENVEA